MMRALLMVAVLSAPRGNDRRPTPRRQPLRRPGRQRLAAVLQPLKIAPHDQFYYAMGWCRTNHYHYKPSDLVDVDRLPTVNSTGELVALHEQGFTVRLIDAPEKVSAIHVHPQATLAAIRGRLTLDALKPGMYVKFWPTVDSKGRFAETIERIELTPPPAEQLHEPLSEGEIAGKVLRITRDRLYISPSTGPARSLTVPIASETQVVVDGHDFRLATVGAKVRVEGRVYRADDRIPADQIFATELDIELLPTPVKRGPKG